MGVKHAETCATYQCQLTSYLFVVKLITHPLVGYKASTSSAATGSASSWHRLHDHAIRYCSRPWNSSRLRHVHEVSRHEDGVDMLRCAEAALVYSPFGAQIRRSVTGGVTCPQSSNSPNNRGCSVIFGHCRALGTIFLSTSSRRLLFKSPKIVSRLTFFLRLFFNVYSIAR